MQKTYLLKRRILLPCWQTNMNIKSVVNPKEGASQVSDFSAFLCTGDAGVWSQWDVHWHVSSGSNLCSTLCDPMDCSPPGSTVHGILQAGILEQITFPPLADLPNSGIEPLKPGLLPCEWILYCVLTIWRPVSEAQNASWFSPYGISPRCTAGQLQWLMAWSWYKWKGGWLFFLYQSKHPPPGGLPSPLDSRLLCPAIALGTLSFKSGFTCLSFSLDTIIFESRGCVLFDSVSPALILVPSSNICRINELCMSE